jgi:glycine oxidase
VRDATGFPIDYRAPGHLMLAFDDDQVAALRARADADARAGVPASWVAAEDVRRMEPAVAPTVVAALLHPEHALVDNARLSAAVAQAAGRAGAVVRPHEEVLRLLVSGGRVAAVETTRSRIATDVVVNAAGCWASRLTPWRGDLVGPAKGEMIALYAAPRPIERLISGAGATISPRSDGRLMVGATRRDGDHSRHISAEAVARMLASASATVPSLLTARFGEAWTGLRPLTPDGIPLIGPDAVSGLVWATGHLGMGILSAPATADVLVALIEGRAPPIPIDAFDPGRFRVTTGSSSG